MSLFGRNYWPVDVIVLYIVRWVKKVQICQKWFRLQSLELFATNVKSLKRKTKDSVTLSEEAQLYESIWTEWLTSGSKSFAYSKMKKKLKTCQKWFWVDFLQLFGANTGLFQLTTFTSKYLFTLAEETQFISDDSVGMVGQWMQKFGLQLNE